MKKNLNKKKPKVSIIIPYYNEERYIKRCIDSLLNQTYNNFEIILIDDSSTDDTISIIQRYNDKRIRLFEHPHVGSPGILRNHGAKMSTGKILLFLDADMQFNIDFIKELIQPILDSNGKIYGTFHGSEKVANLDNIWARCWSIDRMPNPPDESGIFRAILKSKFIESGGFNTKLGYFDDDLSKIGKAKIARKAILSHNNPETLNEVFWHCVWVGKSFSTNMQYITSFFKNRMKPFILLSIIAVLSFIYILFYVSFTDIFNFLILVIIVIYLFEVYLVTIRRVMKEKYYPYLYALPILLTVKNAGYLYGLLRGLLWQKLKN